MKAIIDRIKKYLLRGAGSRPSTVELQADFQARYREFRSLLTANNNALEAMAEMEQALHAGQTFSAAFVRSRSTAVMVNVYKMIQSLLEISGGRYHKLKKSFEKISARVGEILEQETAVSSGPWIIPLHKINKNMADQVGEKMANLGEVAGIEGISTPKGFAISAAASRHFLVANNLNAEINRLLQMLNPENLAAVYEISAEIQKLISNAALPADLETKINDAYSELERETRPGVKVAMRSSALGEDLAGATFAGQYHTELNVDREFLGQTYKEVVAGKYTSRAILYRLKKGYRHEDIEMGVGCLSMVDAIISGIVYSRDPGNPGNPWANINVLRGAAQKVVMGTAPTDLFLVSRQEPHQIIKQELHQEQKPSEAETDTPFPPAADLAIDLTKIALILEKHFGAPQDIEWSIDGDGKIHILQSRPVVFSSDTGENADSGELENPEEQPLLRGQVTASHGVGFGPAHLVANAVDMLQFPRQAVLVVAHPLPEWSPLLNRAAALIAETGSEAGHLATVSREFGVPALFGVQDALKKINNGDVVTVDATYRMVHAGRREDLLARSKPPPDLMAGSPVQAMLREILQYITPLNLTDPSSPYFKSTYCETLHDITRFCHEKSVEEMFSFGEKYHFNQRAAKRLVGEVPLEWWVIDLADGFQEGTDVTGKTVRVENIVSTPMLAIWDGITAFPWQGPPSVSFRGMGSILFQSTMQPGFDPALPSPMSSKNYFLISKNFCNFSVRLGYHFAMVESYLSDLLTENYVSFSFKGGAADARRKAARIQLLSQILSRYDFRVEQKGDSMTARIEKRPVAFLKDRLKILGYLTLHARQVDMVMGKQRSITRYRNKFFSDIEMLLKPTTAEV
ncbi:MAG: PEP-utilizing enzyme [Desulfobulbaceae bacterium]|nr:PEP-utilizing enzyme [Desulfobulbaceae bacterium]